MVKNKKGNIFDAGSSFVEIAIFSMAIIIIALILGNFSTEFEQTPQGNTSEMQSAHTFMQNFAGTWDPYIAFILFVFFIASIVFARLIPTNTIYYVVAIIATPFIGLILMVVQRIMSLFMTEAMFAAVVAQMPITSFIFDYSLFIGILYIFVVFLALFIGKNE